MIHYNPRAGALVLPLNGGLLLLVLEGFPSPRLPTYVSVIPRDAGLPSFFLTHSTKPIGEPDAHAGRTEALLLESTYARIETAMEGIRV